MTPSALARMEARLAHPLAQLQQAPLPEVVKDVRALLVAYRQLEEATKLMPAEVAELDQLRQQLVGDPPTNCACRHCKRHMWALRESMKESAEVIKKQVSRMKKLEAVVEAAQRLDEPGSILQEALDALLDHEYPPTLDPTP